MSTEHEEFPKGVSLRQPEDHVAARKDLYDGIKDELKASFPQSHGGVRVELHDLDYADPEEFSISDQKKSLLGDKYLSRRLRGTLRLYNEADNSLLDERQTTLMRVPHLTQRGTVVHNGSEYASINQARLVPGPYSRVQANGLLETQFNLRLGTGSGFRIGFEPETAQYRMKAGKANLHLYSLLHDMGVPDAQLEKSWGPEILDANRKKYDARVLDKAYERLVPQRIRTEAGPDLDDKAKSKLIHTALDTAQMTEYATRKNLPNYFNTKLASLWVKAAAVPPQIKEAAAELDPEWDLEVYTNTPEVSISAVSGIPVSQIEQIKCASEWFHWEDFHKEAAGGGKGCLMAQLPVWDKYRIVAWSQEHIPAKYLAGDGYERNPHVTVLYGFDPEFKVQTLIQHFTPKFERHARQLTLGKIRRFPAHPGRPESDCLVVEVVSPDLTKLHKALRKEYGDMVKVTFDSYHPHLVLAYVKPGALKHLDGNAHFNGEVYHSDDLIYSAASSKQQTHIYLDE